MTYYFWQDFEVCIIRWTLYYPMRQQEMSLWTDAVGHMTNINTPLLVSPYYIVHDFKWFSVEPLVLLHPIMVWPIPRECVCEAMVSLHDQPADK